MLSEAESRGLVHPGLRAAFGDLGRLVGGDLGPVKVLRLEAVTWRDASLGCPEPDTFYAQVLTTGVRLVLVHQGQEYDYRVEGERAVRCVQGNTREPLERQPLPGIWTRLAGVPTPRSEVAAAELNGKIYVFGGYGGNFAMQSPSGWYRVFDSTKRDWEQKGKMPKGRAAHTSTVAGGKIYFIGGLSKQGRDVTEQR